MEESEKAGGENQVIGEPAPENNDAEVGGRSRGLLYTCFNCGAATYVDPKSTTPFSCWRCGSHSEHSDP